MRTGKYITKYDYIAYYTKQKAMWFFSNAEVKAKMEQMLNGKFNEDDNDDIDEENEIDNYSFYKELKAYKEFSETVEELKEIDKNNPKIAEGIILDQKSQLAVREKFSSIELVVNFEDNKYNNWTNEQLADETKKYCLDHDQFILFQPTFITSYITLDNKEVGLITKPDAFVKYNNEYYVIETKGTSTIKKHHFLDLFYQFKVIQQQEFLDTKNTVVQYNICIVDFVRLNKYDVSFAISPYINPQKSGPSFTISKKNENKPRSVIEAEKRNAKQGIKLIEGENWSITIDEMVYASFETIDSLLEEKELSKQFSFKTIQNFKEEAIQVQNDFLKALYELQTHKDQLLSKDKTLRIPGDFIFGPSDKNSFKDTDMWLELRQVYSHINQLVPQYSGKVFKTSNFIRDIKKDDNPFKEEYKGYWFYNEYIDFYKNKEILIGPKARELLNTLKPKRVYFDFESINSAIRSIDNSLPFTQVVTQNSVIVDDNSKPLSELKCNNMIIDPKLVDIQWFKDVIDSIYQEDDSSYVVYNKSFEATRLKEMAGFINEVQYTNKVSKIVKDMFDIADFFTVKKHPNYLIVIPDLKGFYSIKKVLPLIARDYPTFFTLAGCKDYKKLTVGNGAVCMNETTKRFFNNFSDHEWEVFKEAAKEYCENDVRAMIAVELYVRKLIEDYE
ncbi:DUF2779 domain-containing protein [Ureaplasma diversum]|uniref:DUF2779 domain-containing protein n=1 Tax=Ureaplasma diversum NCTC 246 TaxID=1188241 RepID=A0A084EWF9_9BACT|nr:DUF2779 domain-containing protein [Ureaplasma diversum]KEZ22301.1 Hypothetical protein, DUF2779 family [Ureaplasma diversum NCTC 246]